MPEPEERADFGSYEPQGRSSSLFGFPFNIQVIGAKKGESLEIEIRGKRERSEPQDTTARDP